jgi:hypothetical protein
MPAERDSGPVGLGRAYSGVAAGGRRTYTKDIWPVPGAGVEALEPLMTPTVVQVWSL